LTKSAGICRNLRELAGIGGNQQESEGIRGNQRESEGICRNQQEQARMKGNASPVKFELKKNSLSFLFVLI